MKKILSTRVLVKICVLTTFLIFGLHKCPTCIMLNLEKAIQN